MTTSTSDKEREELRRLVERHQVCWEPYPIWYAAPDRPKVQIGYEIDLWGTHDHPAHPASAGCEECRPVRVALEWIARWVIPVPHRTTRYDIELYDASIHMSRRRNGRKDVLVAIEVIHREGVDTPVDACQENCLEEIETKLKDLGAAPGEWSNRPRKATSSWTTLALLLAAVGIWIAGP